MLFGIWDGDLDEPCIKWAPDHPRGKGNFGGKWRPIVKYRDTRCDVQKRVNFSRCYLGEDSGGPKEPCIRRGSRSPREGAVLRGSGCCRKAQ